MRFRSFGAPRRLQAVLVGLSLLAIFPPTSAPLAHEGHDHGDKPVAAVTAANPRVAAQLENYELVGILRGERLAIYLDRFDTMPDAQIAVTLGGDEEVSAGKAPDGTYTVFSPKFGGSGPLEIVFSITASSGDDLLIGTLQLPVKPVPAMAQPARPSPCKRSRARTGTSCATGLTSGSPSSGWAIPTCWPGWRSCLGSASDGR